MSEDLDRWLRPTVEPMPPRPGTFAAVRARARRRRWARAGLASAAVGACLLLASSAGVALWEQPPPGPTQLPAPPLPSTAPSTGPSGGPTTGPTEGSSSPSGDASPGPPPQAEQSDTAPGRCHTGDLAVRIVPSDSAAGSRYAVLVLTNSTDSPCTLDGHPGMLLLDKDHQPLPTDVRRVRPVPREVLLSPGGSASAELRWSPIPAGDSPCQPPAAFTLVTPPDAYRSLTVRFRANPCHGVVFATSVVAGESGPE